jgi:fibronectin type 3 domain-containing protein
VQFEPVTTGTATGQLTISSNSSANSSTTIALSGTGTISTYAVNLSWDVPTSSTEPIAGYNIYRTMSGSSTYVLISPLINTTTSYVDNTVVSGGAYNYVTRSLDDSGVESLPSNIISVTIP